MTNHYELLYLVAGSYSEEELNPIKSTISGIIAKYGGNITFEDNFGKKKLSYSVKKNNQGYYLIIEFDLEGEKLKDLNNEVKLTNEILRHVVVKRKPGSAHATLSISEKIITDQPRGGDRRKPRTSTPTTEITRKVAPKIEKSVPEKKSEDTKDPSEDHKVKLDNLDEKLDELLEGDII